MKKRKRDMVAETKRFNEQSSYTRSWQVSPVGGTNRLRLRGSARSLLPLGLWILGLVVGLAVLGAIVGALID
jgi:hypothetical protein